MIALYIVLPCWLLGWFYWFVHQENDWTSEVLFNMLFGFWLWPLIGLAQIISGEWERR